MFQIVFDFVYNVLIGSTDKIDYEPILSDFAFLISISTIFLLFWFCIKFVIWCFKIVNFGGYKL